MPLDNGPTTPVAAGYTDNSGVLIRVTPATPLPVTGAGGGTSGGDIEAVGADSESNTTNRQKTTAHLMGYNGTTWDRLRAGLVGVQTAFTGLLNTLPMGRFNAASPTLSDGNVAPLQLDINGFLKSILQAGEAHIGEVGGNSAVKTATMTRPADTVAYASGDLVANSTTAGSVVPITLAVARKNDGTVVIPRVRLKKNNTSVTNAQFRVHLYKTSPTVTNGDNGAWLTTESNYIGYCDINMDRVFSDGAKGFGVPATGNQFIIEPDTGTQNIYALLEARAAYTPTSGEIFTLAVECLRD